MACTSKNTLWVQLVLLTVGGGMPALAPGSAFAQSKHHVLLVLPPLPSDPADSAFALDLAEKLRKAARSSVMRVVPYREMCDIMRASSFSCRMLFRGSAAAQLAAAFRADAYLTGTITRNPSLVIEIGVTSRNRSGYAGSFTLHVDPSLAIDSIAALATKGLDALWLAGELARRCYDARDAGEYADATFYAEGARSLIPNHSVAALCLATVYELTDAPLDTLIKSYAQAFASDPRLDLALQRLVTLYLDKGDTLSANRLMAEQLRRAPDRTTLRQQVVFNWVRLGEPDSAFALLPEDPADEVQRMLLLRMIERECIERGMWRCGLEALARRYQEDQTLAGDTAFYFRIVGAAQRLSDDYEVLRWTAEGIRRLEYTLAREGSAASGHRPAIRALRMAHAGALVNRGDRDSALAVYLGIIGDDPADERPTLAAARALLDPRFLVVDSAVPLDTAALYHADALLTDLARRRPDDSVLSLIAGTYFSTAASLVQQRLMPELASAWLEKALRYDVSGRLQETANGLNGLALSLLVQRLDEQIRDEGRCDLVDQIDDLIERAQYATHAGQNAFPQLAQPILSSLEDYARLVPQYREVLRCNP